MNVNNATVRRRFEGRVAAIAVATVKGVDVSLDTRDDRAELPIVADLGAARETAVVVVTQAAGDCEVVSLVAVAVAAHAGNEADVEAAPCEDGRNVDRRRGRKQAGPQRRSSLSGR